MTGDLSARMDCVLELWAKTNLLWVVFVKCFVVAMRQVTNIALNRTRVWPSSPCSWLRPYHFIWNVIFQKYFNGCCWAQWPLRFGKSNKHFWIHGQVFYLSRLRLFQEGSFKRIQFCLSDVMELFQNDLFYFVVFPLEADISTIVKTKCDLPVGFPQNSEVKRNKELPVWR